MLLRQHLRLIFDKKTAVSEVTNLIITFSVSEDEVSRSSDINSFFNNGRPFDVVSADYESMRDPHDKAKRWYGGTKKLETPLYIGAINHLDMDALVDYLRMIGWESPELVQLMVKGENDSVFRIVSLKDGSQ